MAARGRKRYAKGTIRRGSGPGLADLSDEELLDLRICDLDLQIEGTPLAARIERFYYELDIKGFQYFRPHFWLSDDWFTPDGVPGIAIPFYLAHPRLMRLEQSQMLEIEGGTEAACLRIIRHEAGHAIDNAYRLRRTKAYREVFGPVSKPYPVCYQPKPHSKNFVLHLDMWYAQSHPVEDFAETFAVWLRPRSKWRTRYANWPALAKLEFVDGLMEELCWTKPKVTSRVQVDSLRYCDYTLREHYKRRRNHYGLDHPDSYDRELRKLFSDAPEDSKLPSAVTLLRQVRVEARRNNSSRSAEYQYAVDQVLNEMIQRCRKLNLRVASSPERARRKALTLINHQAQSYLRGGAQRVIL